MNRGALVFMILSWGVILALFIFCLVRTFRKARPQSEQQTDEER